METVDNSDLAFLWVDKAELIQMEVSDRLLPVQTERFDALEGI